MDNNYITVIFITLVIINITIIYVSVLQATDRNVSSDQPAVDPLLISHNDPERVKPEQLYQRLNLLTMDDNIYQTISATIQQDENTITARIHQDKNINAASVSHTSQQ